MVTVVSHVYTPSPKIKLIKKREMRFLVIFLILHCII